MNNKILLYSLSLLLVFASVSAAVPTNPLEFGDGLLFVGSELPEHHFSLETDLTYMFMTFQKSNGLEVDNQTCYYRLVKNEPLTALVMNEPVTFLPDWTGKIFINGTEYLNSTGSYTLGVVCAAEILIEEPDVYSSEGGYLQYSFEIVEETFGGIVVGKGRVVQLRAVRRDCDAGRRVRIPACTVRSGLTAPAAESRYSVEIYRCVPKLLIGIIVRVEHDIHFGTDDHHVD